MPCDILKAMDTDSGGSLGRRLCPRCGTPVRLADLRLYDYRDGLLCVFCEIPEDRPAHLQGGKRLPCTQGTR